MSDQFYQPSVLAPGQLSIPSIANPFPGTSCTIKTSLQLDHLLRQSSIDLGAVATTILSDPGATLQVLRLIGEEFPQDSERPTRMEDCISSLNREHWHGAVCESIIPQDSTLIEEWQRLLEIARCAKALAHSIEGFSPDEAYLVGLLYELGNLPRLLEWELDESWPSDKHALGVMLAQHWKLPRYLVNALREKQDASSASRWGVFMHFARSIAERQASAASPMLD